MENDPRVEGWTNRIDAALIDIDRVREHIDQRYWPWIRAITDNLLEMRGEMLGTQQRKPGTYYYFAISESYDMLGVGWFANVEEASGALAHHDVKPLVLATADTVREWFNTFDRVWKRELI